MRLEYFRLIYYKMHKERVISDDLGITTKPFSLHYCNFYTPIWVQQCDKAIIVSV